MTGEKRVLILDHERDALSTLEEQLVSLGNEWEVDLVETGRQGLALLASGRHFDVTVCDGDLQDIGAVPFLSELRKRSPDTMRVLMTDRPEGDRLLRVGPKVHQVLPRPCPAETLIATVTRAYALRSLLGHGTLRGLISSLESLPGLSGVCTELLREVQSPTASARSIGQIIARDPGLTAKVLQWVNSGFFGLRQTVSSPTLAVALLGFDMVKALALSAHAFSRFETPALLSGLWLRTVQRHSVAVGALAQRISDRVEMRKEWLGDVFVAGLLHDIGKMILAGGCGDPYHRALALARQSHQAEWQAETAVLGTNHGQVGAYLLGLWGLSDSVTEAVAFHHDPVSRLGTEITPLAIVHAADALVHEVTPGEATRQAGSALDESFLASLGLDREIPYWRSLSREVSTPT